MTAMAITAMMSAYSTRPWPSSSLKNANIFLTHLPSGRLWLDGRCRPRGQFPRRRPGLGVGAVAGAGPHGHTAAADRAGADSSARAPARDAGRDGTTRQMLATRVGQ